MKKTIETSFKRIETKYIVAKDDVKDLIKDLKEYVVEDDSQLQPFQTFILIRKILMSFKMLLPNNTAVKKFGCGHI